MDLSSNLKEYIQESIEHSLGLPVSAETLKLKLVASEDARHLLQDQVFLLQDQLKEKDQKMELYRAEASMSAQALKKCIQENQRLVADQADLLDQCLKLEKECALYDRDREALMDFGNDADERAKEAEVRALEAENDCKRLSEELKYYKQECEIHMMNEAKGTEELCKLKRQISELERERLQVNSREHLACSRSCSAKDHQEDKSGDSLEENPALERQMLESLISSVLAKANATGQLKDETEACVHSFLEAHVGKELCQKLWKRINPSAIKIVALVAGFESLLKDKEHLRINLHRAEEEVKVLFEENNMLDKENERLLKDAKESRQGSHERHTASISIRKKRKSNLVTTSIIDSPLLELPRQPLSPLKHNTPELRMRKK